jgi:hypothetical protein
MQYVLASPFYWRLGEALCYILGFVSHNLSQKASHVTSSFDPGHLEEKPR